MAYLRVGSVSSVASGAVAGTLDYLGIFGVSILDVPKVIGASTQTPDLTKTDASKHVVLIRALQNGLTRAGFLVPITGQTNDETVQAMTQLAGSGWRTKPWGVLFGLILVKIKTTPAAQMTPLSVVQDNLPIIAVGAVALVGLVVVLKRRKQAG